MESEISEHIFGRLEGPMHFRLFLQPLVALVFGLRDGLKDAKVGAPAYFWAIFSSSEERRGLIQHGWKSVGKVFVLAFVLDCIFQFMVLKWIYPGGALLIALLLAIVPYILIRGPINRILSRLGYS